MSEFEPLRFITCVECVHCDKFGDLYICMVDNEVLEYIYQPHHCSSHIKNYLRKK